MLAGLGVPAREVRARADLEGVTHLVLPGGESTTIRHLLDLFDLTDELIRRHQAGEVVILGSCAGAILLGRDDGRRPPRLELLDIALERNAYGSQTRSFVGEVEVEVAGLADPVRGLFIRAPRIVETGENVEVLARFDGDPVVVAGPGALAVTFHPELAGDSGVHEHFLAMRPQRSEPTPTRTIAGVVVTAPVNAGRAGSGA